MGKILLGFLFSIIVFYCVAFNFVEHIPTNADPQTIVVVRVTQNGKPIRGRVNGPGVYTKTRRMGCAYIAYRSDATELQVLGENGELLYTISTRTLEDHARLNIDLSTGEVTNTFSFKEYFTGFFPSMGLGFFLKRMVFYAVCLYYFLVLAPLSFLAMIYSIIREKIAGIKRQWAGSWFRLIFGTLIGAFLLFLLIAAPKEVMEELDMLSLQAGFIVFCSGYFLYAFAARTFDAEEIREQRRKDNMDMLSYTYTETTWSDGSKTDDSLRSMAGNRFGVLFVNLMGAILLPVNSIWSMVCYYLAPILDGEPSWKI